MVGQIPSAWYPYRVALTPDDKQLLCICFRGFGNGPNAGKNIPKSSYLGLRGVFQSLNTPTDAELGPMTRNVLTYNGMVDHSADRAKMAGPIVPAIPGKPSEQIKYVVFITKENHSYDAIFDRVPAPTTIRPCSAGGTTRLSPLRANRRSPMSP